jgi:ferric-dicitrate binding protein FerR (iron transport regulator)
MTGPFPHFAELRALLDALSEESITAEQLRRVEELVLAHPEAEAYYVQYMSLYADLSRHFSVLPVLGEESVRNRVGAIPNPQSRRRGEKEPRSAPSRFRLSLSRRFLVPLLGLAAGLLLVVALWPKPRGGSMPDEPAAEPTDNTVAVLLQAPGAVWEEGGPAPRAGAPLPPGRLRLRSGLAHIEFYSGATVILEGPADLELISATAAFCARGKLRATVPPQAQGFTITTPKLDLVDRGTEFGLQVGAGDQTEVHVFRGKVELYNAGANRQAAAATELTMGQGVRLDGPGRIHAIKSDPDAFRTAQDLEARFAEAIRRQQRAWLAGSKILRRDPRLLVHYMFQAEPLGSRTLLDQADGGGQPHEGVVVGCRWGVGRWPGKKGLEFRQVSDRVRFHVPGELDSLTLSAWVRVDALPNRFNSLMMTTGWEEGAPHWHIHGDGKLELGVQGPKKKGGVHYFSSPVLTAERLGQWTHLALVYDRDAGQVTHYVDGQPVTQEGIKLDITLRLGDLELGNWNIGSHRNKSPIRYFRGCIDEFLLFGRALSADEIERLYTQGRPPW